MFFCIPNCFDSVNFNCIYETTEANEEIFDDWNVNCKLIRCTNFCFDPQFLKKVLGNERRNKCSGILC